MKTTLCTLYNSLYLDKGIVIYESLKECSKDFELYVLCMDDKCFEVLSELGEKQLKPIRLCEIENQNMLKAKANRTVAEYCWTCSSRLIQYILETYKPECCTYIDADMFFYYDPQILVDEMLMAGKSVMIVPHRFTNRNIEQASVVGTYCVEFNCFKNDAYGKEVLNHWHNQCLECCSNLGDGIHWGDQKYMDEWPLVYNEIVHVCEHPGAGIAPWNIEWYKDLDVNKMEVTYKKDNKRAIIVFFHFQSLSYISESLANTSLMTNNRYLDYNLAKCLYIPYLKKIKKTKEWLKENYGLDLLIKSHPANNKRDSLLKGILRRFGILQFIKRVLKFHEPLLITVD